ncbi:MAG: FHA domain-containing protein [Candidatus Nitricoxidivorans perseverans]|uniref:FHA domain-containing protein n=1 Tax=Candidatus Nitricoxidivorans perseverans TaxID=2975601 RepID=A0AA49FL36_9PROT|nr:MAG: FHA domain-containing protein [Candidatus Nitricoxidivorans perseverans]
MAKLILGMDGLVLKEIPLIKERTTLGRKPHNDIQIDNLAISGEHAVIVTILNDSFLEDLGSTNGTYINGQPVKKHFLQNGDTIELGKYRLKYVNEVPQQTSPADFEKTMVLRPDMMRKTAEQVAGKSFGDTQAGMKFTDHAEGPATPPPAAAAPPPLPAGALQILSGGNAGRELVLTKTLTTLGKPGVQVAVIARRPHGYFITHVEGTRFPVVNGKVLDAQAHPLNDHDIIELAGIKMEFFLKD